MDSLAYAEIGLDSADFKRSHYTIDLDEATSPRANSEDQYNPDNQLDDTLIVEIVDRGNKSTCRSEDFQPSPSIRAGSENHDKCDVSSNSEDQPPKEMNLFRAEFRLERSTLLRSPYFARLLCGACKQARKLQLNLRDQNTNIEAMMAASFFLESGVQDMLIPTQSSTLLESSARALKGRIKHVSCGRNGA
jgi:hypothetical protein